MREGFQAKTCHKNVCKNKACTRPHSTCQPLILRGMREMNPTYFCITFRAYNTCFFLPSETSAIKGLSCNFENYANYVITQNTIKTWIPNDISFNLVKHPSELIDFNCTLSRRIILKI